jgi:hypothetical protein
MIRVKYAKNKKLCIADNEGEFLDCEFLDCDTDCDTRMSGCCDESVSTDQLLNDTYFDDSSQGSD